MADTLLPSSVKDERFKTMAELAARISDLSLSPLLVYLVDAVESSALVELATQFHVMGTEGWNAATTDDARRALIKSAIDLHRHKGTPYAISLALTLRGLSGRSVEWFEYGGDPFHFRVKAKIPQGQAFSASDWDSLVAIVEEAKNVRSHFEGITLQAETSGTKHRALRTEGTAKVVVYPSQPAQASTSGAKRSGVFASAMNQVSVYPSQPGDLAVESSTLKAQVVSIVSTTSLYPAI